MNQETILRISNKLELEGKKVNTKNINKAYKEHLKFKEYTKTPIERNNKTILGDK